MSISARKLALSLPSDKAVMSMCYSSMSMPQSEVKVHLRIYTTNQSAFKGYQSRRAVSKLYIYSKYRHVRLSSLIATGIAIACRSTKDILGFLSGPRITPLYTSPNSPLPSNSSAIMSSVEISQSSRIRFRPVTTPFNFECVSVLTSHPFPCCTHMIEYRTSYHTEA